MWQGILVIAFLTRCSGCGNYTQLVFETGKGTFVLMNVKSFLYLFYKVRLICINGDYIPKSD